MNYNAAKTCYDKAKQFYYSKNYEKSIKFCKKGIRLDSRVSEICNELLEKIKKSQLIETGIVHEIKSQSELDGYISGFKGLIVIDCYAVWCGPCKNIAPIFEGFSKEFDNVLFLKVNIDNNQDIAMKYKVNSVPNFILFKDSKKIDTIKGANQHLLKQKIESYK